MPKRPVRIGSLAAAGTHELATRTAQTLRSAGPGRGDVGLGWRAELRAAGRHALLLSLLGGCADPHWDTQRWPARAPDAPAQPHSESATTGVSLRAMAIEWEPQAVVVELEISNQGDAPLEVERAAILLAWDELEYPTQAPGRDAIDEPALIQIPAGAAASTTLRYQLGRALTGPGARLILRASSRGGVALVDLPQLELPALRAR